MKYLLLDETTFPEEREPLVLLVPLRDDVLILLGSMARIVSSEPDERLMQIQFDLTDIEIHLCLRSRLEFHLDGDPSKPMDVDSGWVLDEREITGIDRAQTERDYLMGNFNRRSLYFSAGDDDFDIETEGITYGELIHSDRDECRWFTQAYKGGRQ